MRIAVVGAGGVGRRIWRGAGQGGRRRHLHRPRRASRGDEEQGPEDRRRRAATRISCRPRRPTIPKTVGPVDFVLFCVKLWDVESAGEHIKPLVGPDTAVIPLQNGIDAPERLVPILGRRR